MHKEYILLNGFWKAKKGFTAGFHVPLTRRYGNENGNGRSAASGNSARISAQGFTFCVTVDSNWIVCRPKQIRLLVEHFENKL